ncbi:MAG: hypothetical protein ABMA25_22255, partial [Ilumatobacteraceae bacterium]
RWDRTTDTLTSVDVNADGSVFSSYSARFHLSLDGSTVVIESYANGLVPGDTDGAFDLFAVLPGGGLEMLSVNAAEQPTDGGVIFLGMSANGQRILMGGGSVAQPLGIGEWFVRDRTAGTTISLESLVAPGSVVTAFLSADGQHVAARVKPASNVGVVSGISSIAFIDLGSNTTQLVPVWPLVEHPVSEGYGISWVRGDALAVQVGNRLVHSDGTFEPYVGLETSVQYSLQYWRSGDGTVAVPAHYYGTPSAIALTTPLGGSVDIHRSATAGVAPNGSIGDYLLTDDGSTVLFTSAATNLGPVVSAGTHLYLYHVDF